MDSLYGTIGSSVVDYLETAGGKFDTAAISMEPGNGVVKRGTVVYLKSGVLYAPAAADNISENNNLMVLRKDVDTNESATTAALASAYSSGSLLGKFVVLSDGVTNLNAAQALILRKQGIVLKPFDDWSADAIIADNSVSVNVTVTNDGHGTGSASPASGTKGTEVTLSASPSAGYAFDGWEVVSGGVTVENNKFTIGDAAVTVKAKFKLLPTVTVTNDGHGTGSASPAYGAAGTEITLTATPADTYEFDTWEVVSGGVTVENNKFTIGNENVTVKAKFRLAG